MTEGNFAVYGSGGRAPAITVSQLNNYIKQVFEAEELLHNIEVIGDIDGVRQSGNQVYFTLKDDAAVINCVCFYPKIMADTKNGTRVVVRGTVNYWHKAGKISFVVNSVQTFGFGALFLRFQQLQEKLRAEGLFDVAVKKSLPGEIKRLGVVTSKTGAVIHDISCVARRRNPMLDIVVCDTAVQGAGAENEIANAIELLCGANVDVIIVARGGGSREDLNAFNSERIARAVFASKIPIVSAVGHESDWTLIDFVADLRAATPSAAAELCVREVTTQRERALGAFRTLRAMLMHKTDQMESRVLGAYEAMKNTILNRLTRNESHLELLAAKIEANNPMAVLKRGFARPSRGYDELKIGDEFEIMFYNGSGVAKWIKDLKN